MNKVILSGRLTRDPEIRYSNGDNPIAIARYTLAVNREFKKDRGQDADFVSCKCFGKTAEFAEKYLHQGIKMIISGRIQTGSYEKEDGNRVYTTEVVVDSHEFAESKKNNSGAESSPSGDGFSEIPDDIGEDELPFS